MIRKSLRLINLQQRITVSLHKRYAYCALPPASNSRQRKNDNIRKTKEAATTLVTKEHLENFEPRVEFTLPTQFDYRTWYPRHMSIQLKRMEGKLRTVDLIIEVHDARVALTGVNLRCTFPTQFVTYFREIRALSQSSMLFAHIFWCSIRWT